MKTAFAKRNPALAKYVPDLLENLVDSVLPDAMEARMEKSAKAVEGENRDVTTQLWTDLRTCCEWVVVCCHGQAQARSSPPLFPHLPPRPPGMPVPPSRGGRAQRHPSTPSGPLHPPARPPPASSWALSPPAISPRATARSLAPPCAATAAAAAAA